jgi:rhodanese-related sulfurtransferase
MLEDDNDRLARFWAVGDRLGVEIIDWPDANAMLAELTEHLASAALISLDHDLVPLRDIDPGDGLDVAKHLATLPPACPVVVHTSNGRRGDAMAGELELAGWRYFRVLPVGDDWIEHDWYRVVRRALRKRQ